MTRDRLGGDNAGGNGGADGGSFLALGGGIQGCAGDSKSPDGADRAALGILREGELLVAGKE